MPLIKLYYGDTYTTETIETINTVIHHSLESCFKIPADDTFQLWVPMTQKNNFVDDCYLLAGGQRNNQFLYIEIFCGLGRTISQKKALYQTIAEQIDLKTSLTKENIFILLNEVPLENWSFGDGKAQMIQ
ncbi:tautomerase family protein [Brochothrix thermosphacta]